MINCYRILGVEPSASPREIRAAYLAKMKQLHPDVSRGEQGRGLEAGEVTLAYWQLRETDRRCEHDRLVLGTAQPRSLDPHRPVVPTKRVRAAAGTARTGKSAMQRRPKRPARPNRRLQPLRSALGAVTFCLSGAALLLALTYLEPPPDVAVSIERQVRERAQAALAPMEPRIIEPVVTKAAANAFQEILQRAGSKGTRLYARQCLLHLITRPTMAMRDHCVAFDQAGFDWEERQRLLGRQVETYFDKERRFDRYKGTADALPPGAVRQMIQADAANLAVNPF